MWLIKDHAIFVTGCLVGAGGATPASGDGTPMSLCHPAPTSRIKPTLVRMT